MIKIRPPYEWDTNTRINIAYDLYEWARAVWETGDRIKASKIKRVADKHYHWGLVCKK